MPNRLPSGMMGWGIFGTGRMAGDFANALNQVSDAKTLAVASRSQQSADHFADRFDIPCSYSAYHQLLDNPDIDVVYIATPHSSHFEHVMMCLQAGKAVLCEKPFAINAGQAEQMISLATEKKLFLMEAMWTRFVPSVLKLRALLQAGAIGDVQLMLAGGAYMPEYDPDFYLFDKSLGGGILLDAGVYLLSMASMVFGVPEKILAMGTLGETGVDEHDAITLGHSKGELASLFISHRATSAPDMTLMGSKGKIYLHPPIFCPSGITLSQAGKADEVFDFPDSGSGYRFEIMEVNRCLKAGKKQSEAMPLAESLSIMQTMDEVRRQFGLQYPMETQSS
jgi:dihydrodiol dehydrogenase / D-xylose 1-dehydrogenase (NADP)